MFTFVDGFAGGTPARAAVISFDREARPPYLALMRILYCGDVVGRAGRDIVTTELPKLRERLRLDFVIVNGENAAGGFGITAEICRAFYQQGADAVLLGNHSWDQREIIAYIDGDPKLLRPLNYPKGTPGRGVAVFALADGRKVMVMQLMGRLFMDPLDCPFQALDEGLAPYRLGGNVQAIVVDIHAEATSEKMAIGHCADGRASFVAGTHTHIPTADAQILPGGTGYITDVGMCGDYDSVIGIKKEVPIQRFRRKLPGERMTPAEGPATLCAVFVETDDKTGKAKHIAPLRLGGRLAPQWPDATDP
jgi:metallophosphoesterase (TIGR00282 family)